jgi:phosphatidate cytidylyltransferase
LLQRTLTALVGIPVLLAVIWWGAPWLTIVVALIAAQGVREAYRLLPSGATPLPTILGVLWAVALVLGAQAGNGLNDFLSISAVVAAAGGFICLLWLIAYYTGGKPLPASLYLFGGPLYAGFLLGHVLMLQEIGDTVHAGRDWLIAVLLMIFAVDTGAYLIGRSVGRRPMAPSISPNKTWEGAAGGLACAVAAAIILGLTFDLGAPPWQLLVIGVTVGVVAQCGDLFESKLKRLSQVKDSGSIIPGHGGILDRLDSVVVSIPVVYYLLATVFEP